MPSAVDSTSKTCLEMPTEDKEEREFIAAVILQHVNNLGGTYIVAKFNYEPTEYGLLEKRGLLHIEKCPNENFYTVKLTPAGRLYISSF